MGKGILVSPTVDGNLLLGPTAIDGEDKTDKEVSPEFFASIFDVAERSVTGIPKNKTITSFCGLRSVGNPREYLNSLPLEGKVSPKVTDEVENEQKQ